MTVLHGNAIRLRTDLERSVRHATVLEPPEQLSHLTLDLRLFFRYVRDDVAEDVEGGHARIPRSRNRLQSRHEELLDAEALVQRGECDCGNRRGTIRIRDDCPFPAT